jgi:hypothetical protein
MNRPVVNITPEQISRAISEYLKRDDMVALRITYNIQTEQTDQSEPTCVGKLIGATVELTI